MHPLYTRGSNINTERSNLSTMEKGVLLELTRGSANWTRVVEEIVKLEKKTFPKHESLAQTFDGELRKRNAGLLYVAADGDTLGYVMYSWPSSLSASITKLAGTRHMSTNRSMKLRNDELVDKKKYNL